MGLGPPKVLLEHKLFNRGEKQCYSSFLHWGVFPSCKSDVGSIMLRAGIRWTLLFFSPLLLFSMCRKTLRCKRSISHRRCYCTLTCSICNVGTQTSSLCERTQSLLSLPLSFAFCACWMLLLISHPGRPEETLMRSDQLTLCQNCVLPCVVLSHQSRRTYSTFPEVQVQEGICAGPAAWHKGALSASAQWIRSRGEPNVWQ